MNRNRYYIVVVSILLLVWSSCANIVPPTGGRKDERPPKLVSRTIKDSALQFKGGKMSFEFDEIIQIKDIQTQFNATPMLRGMPKISAHRRTLTIDIPDSLLQAQTTYQFSFGNAIQDIHEGNAIQGFNITFSTGTYFDSLSISGKLIDAATGLPDTTSWVTLYPSTNDDSIIIKQKPTYAIKASNGVFVFNNLPSREFSMYAFSDINNNMKYDAIGERVGFYDEKVNPQDTSTHYVLYTFFERQVPDSLKSKRGMAKNQSTSVPINTPLTYSLNADTTQPNQRTFDFTKNLVIELSTPIQQIDPTKIRLFQNDTLDASATSTLDSMNRIIKIETEWKPDAVYTIKLLKGFARDSSAKLAEAGEYTFRTKRKSDYGTLIVRVDKRQHQYIQLLKGEKVLQQKLAQDTVITFAMLTPDTYHVRIFNDNNMNTIWDSGTLFPIRKHAERIEHINKELVIKANWENKIDLTAEKRNAKKTALDR